ncbi:hypothetical protein [uncultured Draconibacterium sp.]|uniref:hypothetical protein n=1 Tax=uncultured Draconibacterium sp. TaxID=1573823 RepID=UPI0029C8DEFB|nr:hypothetical protein [uncultured Draconibacterium sp.]
MKELLGALFILLCLSTWGCSSSNKSNSDDSEFNYEIEVLDQIFEQLTEEMQFNYGFPKAPPPPRPTKDKNGEITGYDSTLYLQQIKNYQIDTANFEAEPRSVLLAISDTLYCLADEEIPTITQLPSEDYHTVIKNIKPANKLNRKIPIELLKNTGYFYLKYSSEYRNEPKRPTNLNESKASGIRLSRIYFNESKTLGIFTCEYYRTSDDAYGGLILIRKVDGKWQIDEYINNWIT